MKVRITSKLISLVVVLALVLVQFPQMTFATTGAVSDEYITYRDFTQGITDEVIAGINNKGIGSDGLIVNNNGVSLAAKDTDSLKIGLREVPSSVPQFQACLYYGNGAMNNSSLESFSDGLDLKGNIVLEAEMKFDTMANTTYYPLAIVPDTAINSGTQSNYTHEIISVKNGTCYIGGTEKGDVAADTYYKFKLILNIDGDAQTVDTFSAEVSAGNVVYTGTGKINNLKGGNTTLQDYAKKMTSIAFINVVRGLTGDGAKDATTQEYDWVNANIKTLKFYYTDEFTLTDYITADVTCGTITAGSDVNVKAVFTNETGSALTPCFIAAFYRGDGQLVDAAIVSNETLTAKGTYTLNKTFGAPSDIDSNAYIKIFAWNGMTSLVPLMDAIVK